jgi:hypothetical protein
MLKEKPTWKAIRRNKAPCAYTFEPVQYLGSKLTKSNADAEKSLF